MLKKMRAKVETGNETPIKLTARNLTDAQVENRRLALITIARDNYPGATVTIEIQNEG